MATEDYDELRSTPFQRGAQLEAYRLVRDSSALASRAKPFSRRP
jgi:hypothetical protein